MAALTNSSTIKENLQAGVRIPCEILTGSEVYINLKGQVRTVADDYYEANNFLIESVEDLRIETCKMRAAWLRDANGNVLSSANPEKDAENAVKRINGAYYEYSRMMLHQSQIGRKGFRNETAREYGKFYEAETKKRRANFSKDVAKAADILQQLPQTVITLSDEQKQRIANHALSEHERADAEADLAQLATRYPVVDAVLRVLAQEHTPISIVKNTNKLQSDNPFMFHQTMGLIFDYEGIKKLRSADPSEKKGAEVLLLDHLLSAAFTALNSDINRYYISETTWPPQVRELKKYLDANNVPKDALQDAPALVLAKIGALVETTEDTKDFQIHFPKGLRTYHNFRRHVFERAGLPEMATKFENGVAVPHEAPRSQTPGVPSEATASTHHAEPDLPMLLLTGKEAYIDASTKEVNFVINDYHRQKHIDERQSCRSRIAWVASDFDPEAAKNKPVETAKQVTARIYSFHTQQDVLTKNLLGVAYQAPEEQSTRTPQTRSERSRRIRLVDESAKKRANEKGRTEAGITKALAELPEHVSVPEETQKRIRQHALSDEEEHFARAAIKEMMQRYPMMANALHVMGLRNVPLNIIKDLNKLKGEKEADFDYSSATGLVLDLSALQKTKDTKVYNYFITAQCVSSAFRALSIEVETLGVTSPKQWQNLNEEMQAFLDRHKMEHQTGYISYPDILMGNIAALESVVGISEDVLSREIPKCYGAYKKFRGIMAQKLGDAKSAPPPVPPVTDPGAAADAGNAAAAKALTASHRPDRSVHYPAPGGSSAPSVYDPKPFTDPSETDLYALEQNLINGTKPFMEEALSYDPPHNQCSVRLLLNDNAQKGGFPIHIVFRNKDRADRQYTIFTGTDDLAKAIELKKTIQSHILNHPRIVPLWMSRLQAEHPGGERLKPSEMIPSSEPVSEKVVNHYDYFGGEFTFDVPSEFGTNINRVTIRVPLGLDYAPGNKEAANEAVRRMGIVKARMELLRKQERWETVGEATQMLKSVISNVNHPLGWHMNKHMKIDMPPFDSMPIELPFPPQGDSFTHPTSGQKTTLKYAHLDLEKGEKFPNSTWRLCMTIQFEGVNPDGSPLQLELNPTINLHTSDETAAQLRAVETLESLATICHGMSQRHPSAMWKLDEGKNLIICDRNGYQPADPDPRNFAEMHEDMVHFKTNFSVHEIEEERKVAGGKIYVTLGVKRGTEADGDLVDFNNSTRQPLRIRFSIDEKEGNKLPQFIEAAGANFKKYIDDNYGNRRVSEGEILRKKRSGFRSDTIGNLLIKVFETAQKYGGLETVGQQFVAMGGRIEILDAPVSARKGVPKAPMWRDALDERREQGNRGIKPTSIKPGNDDLNRTGRSQAKGDE